VERHRRGLIPRRTFKQGGRPGSRDSAAAPRWSEQDDPVSRLERGCGAVERHRRGLIPRRMFKQDGRPGSRGSAATPRWSATGAV
jgi:hypothetical protein